MTPTPLTPAEIEEERKINNRRVAFLDAKIAALSVQLKQQLMKNLAKTAANGVKMLSDRLVQWKIHPPSDKTEHIAVCILPSSEMPIINGRVASGVAWPTQGAIGVINHLIFAPKEVQRSVVIHECLHLVYPHLQQKLSQQPKIRMGILEDYPEDHHVEEEWVRKLEARVCGSINKLEYWELAVEEFGDNWKPAYEKFKMLKSSKG
ncbi:MAG: M48 family peptidase [Verrucomicrobia bacterium]|nr:MAG: M48 family peptidase [Verrucomicrobiota bacterium]